MCHSHKCRGQFTKRNESNASVDDRGRRRGAAAVALCWHGGDVEEECGVRDDGGALTFNQQESYRIACLIGYYVLIVT